MGKTTDKLYITSSEWSQNTHGGGGPKSKPSTFKRLPFYCCALSLTPFKIPKTTREGFIFDLENILPFIKKYGCNPCSGSPMTASDLISLHFHKNSNNEFFDPVTFNVFTQNTKIVAVKNTGHVYAFDTIHELNIKTHNWLDLMTDEPFERDDIIDPAQLRNLETFWYKVRQEKDDLRGDDQSVKKPNSKQVSSSKSSEVLLKDLKALPQTKAYNHAHFSSNSTSMSFTSSTTPVLKNEPALISDLEYMLNNTKNISRCIFESNSGNLEIDIHCKDAPYESYYFLESVKAMDGEWFEIQSSEYQIKFPLKKPDIVPPRVIPLPASKTHSIRGQISLSRIENSFSIIFKPASHLDASQTILGTVVKASLPVLDDLEGIFAVRNDKFRIRILKNTFQECLDDAKGLGKHLIAQEIRNEKAKKREVYERLCAIKPSVEVIGRYLEDSKNDIQGNIGAIPVEGVKKRGNELTREEGRKKRDKGGFDFSNW